MRTLLILRGCQGAGKSHWIKENNLQLYCIEPDKIRLLFASPELKADGDSTISAQKDKNVWQLIYQLLEERMKDGHFTIIDAMHLDQRSVSRYQKLADKYDYSTFYYQPEVNLEQCLKNNRQRADYKQVPDKVITDRYKKLESSKLNKQWKRIYHIDEIKNYICLDFSEYQKVKVIGDLQGCATVTKKALLNEEGELDRDTVYIFVGDYIDRGIENYETLQFIQSIAHLKNVILLEGNHEQYLKEFALYGKVNNRFFMRWTWPELMLKMTGDKLSDPEKLEPNHVEKLNAFQKALKKQITSRLRQCCFFQFKDKRYLVTHAGVSSPKDLTFISTRQMIDGVGAYSFEIGKAYEENNQSGKCQDIIQLHGHRKVESTPHSICLEDGVEFGEYLVIAEISEYGIKVKRYKNDIFKDWTQILPFFNPNKREDTVIQPTEDEEVNQLIQNPMVHAKYVAGGLVSINFSNKAFYKGEWNDFTIKARGLFVDEVTGEVAMRSYNKFFNTGQLTSVYGQEFSYEKLSYPLQLWHKENGFLGIMSAIKGNLVLASKSMTVGTFATYFKELWANESKAFKQHTLEVLQKHNASLVFEVVHNDDPHIVDYQKEEHLFILDAIENKLNFGKNNLDIQFSRAVIKDLKTVQPAFCQYKTLYQRAKNTHELKQAMADYDQLMTEGFVAEDANGFLFKYKAQYYSDWKRRRGLIQKFLKNGKINRSKCVNDEDLAFMKWVEKKGVDFCEGKSIITLRQDYLKHLS